MKKILAILAACTLCTAAAATLAACDDKGGTENVEAESITIYGDEDISLGLGESVTFSATVAPENATDKTVTWVVAETNLDSSYTLQESTFTASDRAGYAVIEAKTSNGLSDRVTIVVNAEIVPPAEQIMVTFYAPDGETIVDIRYADGSGKVTPPDFAVAHNKVEWVDSLNNVADFSTLTFTEDASFTAKLTPVEEKYVISFWYYNSEGVLTQQGKTYEFAVDGGESVPAEDVEQIKAAIEQATGKTVINFRAEMSADGLTVKWIAEYQGDAQS